MQVMSVILFLAFAFLSAAVPTPESITMHTLIPRAEHNPRGVAFNKVKFPHLFNGPNSKVGWIYNWGSDLCGKAREATGSSVEYVPMLHSNKADHTRPWFANVERCAKAGDAKSLIHVLAFNEPDQCGDGSGGACMSMDAVLSTWSSHMQPLASNYGSKIKLGSPAVTNGADGTDKWGLRYLATFLDKCKGCQVDFINIHWYEGAHQLAYFKQHVSEAVKVGKGRPVWITEFGVTTGSMDEKKAFLKEAMKWLDVQEGVHRYAYQMAVEGILVNKEGTGLTDLGNTFTYA